MWLWVSCLISLGSNFFSVKMLPTKSKSPHPRILCYLLELASIGTFQNSSPLVFSPASCLEHLGVGEGWRWHFHMHSCVLILQQRFSHSLFDRWEMLSERINDLLRRHGWELMESKDWGLSSSSESKPHLNHSYLLHTKQTPGPQAAGTPLGKWGMILASFSCDLKFTLLFEWIGWGGKDLEGRRS